MDYPSSSQYFTAVGGTSLFLTRSDQYSSEAAWSLSGGGQSLLVPQPSWQLIPGVPNNGIRDIADVAFNADPNTGFYVTYQGAWYWEGGTSFGGPNWAALWALGLQSINGTRTGSAAPLIYTVAKDHHELSRTLHDISSGYNGYYNATPGWDYPTGWGSPNGANLVNWIKKHF